MLDLIMNYRKRYEYYPSDLGDFVIMDDDQDLMLATCGNRRIAELVVDALNEAELSDSNYSTKLH